MNIHVFKTFFILLCTLFFVACKSKSKTSKQKKIKKSLVKKTKKAVTSKKKTLEGTYVQDHKRIIAELKKEYPKLSGEKLKTAKMMASMVPLTKMTFILKAKGKLLVKVLNKGDKPRQAQSTWKKKGETLTLNFPDRNGSIIHFICTPESSGMSCEFGGKDKPPVKFVQYFKKS